MITELAGALAQLGAVVHGGGVVAFAALFAFRSRLSFVDDAHLVRLYRGWGAGNGLSLAAWVYGTILRYPSQVNPGDPLPWAYLPDFGGADAALKSVTAICMLVLWVSYVVLEIWTLDPGRLLDRDGVVTDVPAFADTVRRVTRHLGFNALLVIAIALCAGVGGRI
jgi:hypothetical protein